MSPTQKQPMTAKPIPAFSTKPEAIRFLKSGAYEAVSWRQKGGADKGRRMIARLAEGKIQVEAA